MIASLIASLWLSALVCAVGSGCSSLVVSVRGALAIIERKRNNS